MFGVWVANDAPPDRLHSTSSTAVGQRLGAPKTAQLRHCDTNLPRKSIAISPLSPVIGAISRYSPAVAKKAANSAEFERDYADGEVICSEGESSSEMFVIQKGSVRIFKASAKGDLDLALLSRGDFFGEMSVLEGLPRDASASAVGSTRVLVMSTGALLVRLRRDPTFAFELLHRLSGRVRALNSRLLEAIEKGGEEVSSSQPSGPAGTMMMYMPELADGD